MAGNVAEHVLPKGDDDYHGDEYTEGYTPPGIVDGIDDDGDLLLGFNRAAGG